MRYTVYMKKVLTASLLLFPVIASAQGLKDFFSNMTLFLGDVLIPFLLSAAFVIFIINVIRYFVFGSDNQDGQEKAKALALYSVMAFVLFVVFWGVINMLTSSLNLNCIPVDSDYVTRDFVGPSPNPCP